MTEFKMIGWHHRLNGHEFEQAPGGGEGQGSLACCSPGGHKESDMTEQLNNNNCCCHFDIVPPSLLCRLRFFFNVLFWGYVIKYASWFFSSNPNIFSVLFIFQ